jgi:hypothetical protein
MAQTALLVLPRFLLYVRCTRMQITGMKSQPIIVMLGSLSRASRSFSSNQCRRAVGADAVMKSVNRATRSSTESRTDWWPNRLFAPAAHVARRRVTRQRHEEPHALASTQWAPSPKPRSALHRKKKTLDLIASNEPFRSIYCNRSMLEPRIIGETCVASHTPGPLFRSTLYI